MVLRVETLNGDIMTLYDTVKKNWDKNKNAIYSILIGLGVAVVVQLLMCAQQILAIGNGQTFILFLKTIMGEMITAVTAIGALLCGSNEKNQADYLVNHGKVIIDKDNDGIPDE